MQILDVCSCIKLLQTVIFKKNVKKKLCQFKHSQSVKINQFKCEKCETIVISDEALKTHIDEFHAENTTHNIEDEEMFDNYVKTNFPTLFDYYLKNDRYFPCQFCDYTSKRQNLKNIEDEITTHLAAKHEKILATFDPVDTEYENWIHEEYLQFFCSE